MPCILLSSILAESVWDGATKGAVRGAIIGAIAGGLVYVFSQIKKKNSGGEKDDKR